MDGNGIGRMTVIWPANLYLVLHAFRNLWTSRPAEHCLTRLLLLCRLYAKGRILGHKRAKRNTTPSTTLVQIEGVTNKEDAQFYLGKVR